MYTHHAKKALKDKTIVILRYTFKYNFFCLKNNFLVKSYKFSNKYMHKKKNGTEDSLPTITHIEFCVFKYKIKVKSYT